MPNEKYRHVNPGVEQRLVEFEVILLDTETNLNND